MNAGTGARKDEHLRLASDEQALHLRTTGLELFRLRHQALPARDLNSVSLHVELFGRRLSAPILVSAMTGGTARASGINARLAMAAADTGIGMVLGSGRALLEDESLTGTYSLPCRPRLLLANLGLGQLTQPSGMDDAERLVGLLRADGLTVHCNALQEAIQPEGNTQLDGAVEAIRAVVKRLAPMPVIVKEVGFGFDEADLVALAQAGVAGVDVAGAGGTNWATVEGARAPRAKAVAAAFSDWGRSTSDSLAAATHVLPSHMPIIASGGITDGVESAKCLALGASAVGFARHLLLAALDDRATEAVHTLLDQLRIATWLAGASSATDLDATHLRMTRI